MMAAPGHVFHVEFGFNDTELTRVLERQEWNKAEKIIIDNAQTSLLDEGCGQRIPLYIVLCGEFSDYSSSSQISSMARNFHIARLLVQNGADVNFRVPEVMMSEYFGPGQSALDLVVDFYTKLTSGDLTNEISSSDERVIGFNEEPMDDIEEILDLLCDTVFIMLGHGGDPNLSDKNRESLLHRAVRYSCEPRMARLLCENGANINGEDAQGNTPLISVCARDDVVTGDEGSAVRGRFLGHLLNQADIQVNARNKQGCTALFHCLLEGDTHSSLQLLQHGADPTLRATILYTRQDHINSFRIRAFSPLLVSLCFPKYLSHRDDVDIESLWRQPVVSQHIAHLVDKGYFSRIQLMLELHAYLVGEPIMRGLPEPYLLDRTVQSMSCLGALGVQLVNAMFGATSSTLKQLSMRVVFRRYFLVAADGRPGFFSLDRVDDAMLRDFLSYLTLPHDLMTSLCVETFRQKLGSQLMYYAQMHCDMLSGSDSSSIPSGENDSDLEYW